MNVVISGGRNYKNENKVYDLLEELNPELIFVGDCPTGVDKFVTSWARVNNKPIYIFKADWEKYGKSAGPRRNAQMIHDAIDFNVNVLIAFPGGAGTKSAIEMSKGKMITLQVQE